MEVDLGPIDAIPTDRCIAVGDDTRAVAVRVGDDVRVFENRCLHQDSPLAEGRVFDDKLQCPLHFWRYHLPSGVHVGGNGTLASHPVRIRDGHAVVDLPDAHPTTSLRDQLLAHARDWDRDSTPRRPAPDPGRLDERYPR